MGWFNLKLAEQIPELKKLRAVARNGVIKEYVYLKKASNMSESSMQLSYIEESTQYMMNNKGKISKYLLLMAEQEMMATKAAAYISLNADMYRENEYDEYDDYYEDYEDYDDYGERYDDDEDEEFGIQKLRVIDLSKNISDEKTLLGNGYVPLLTEITEDDYVLFKGLLDDNSIKEKMELITTCPAKMIFIHIEPQQQKCQWVQELRIDFQSDVLKLSVLTNSYFEGILDYLLKESGYRLKEISEKKLLYIMQKQRGKKFQEKDIAWYLEQAVLQSKNKRKNEKIILQEDFEDLNLKKQSAMQQLQGMTGLKNLKQIAEEVAAITKEKMINENLKTLHNHMIFVGSSGTGKTTAAKILSDIMAEEGDTNATMVVADRQRLIGKYVGHTAANVASVFQEARGGVLFVDEAGFFLNQESGGYLDEAIKEFVRYMELYTDVTVIFAMYTSEVTDFLNLDIGLSSRITRIVDFKDYTNEELAKITIQIVEGYGYQVERNASNTICKIMEKIRLEQKEKFGNAREARKLAEGMVRTISMKKYDERELKNELLVQDITETYKRMCIEQGKRKKMFGFQESTQRREEKGKVSCM